MAHISKYYRIYWYIMTLVSSTVYNIVNWSRATSFTFFNEFDGNNLLFVVWIAIVLLPMITRFEGFGIKIESQFSEIESDIESKLEKLIKENNGLPFNVIPNISVLLKE